MLFAMDNIQGAYPGTRWSFDSHLVHKELKLESAFCLFLLWLEVVLDEYWGVVREVQRPVEQCRANLETRLFSVADPWSIMNPTFGSAPQIRIVEPAD